MCTLIRIMNNKILLQKDLRDGSNNKFNKIQINKCLKINNEELLILK